MKLWLVLLVICFRPGTQGWAADDTASVCPKPSEKVQSACREITYKDLPADVPALLKTMKCRVGPDDNYDYGSAVDLNGDGSPEYSFCCQPAPHGPCGAVLVGKVGSRWKDLTAKGGLLGFDGACNQFLVLETRHNGFHDVCLPIQIPPVWQFDNGRYSAVKAPDAKGPK